MVWLARLARLVRLGLVNLVGQVSICAKFQLPSLSGSGLKVCGSGVVWGGVVWVGSEYYV